MYLNELIEAINRLYEDLFPLNEMSNYHGEELNLPVNIWIDGPRNLQHGKRIKFQNNYSTKFDETNLITLTLSDNPTLGKTFKRVKVKSKDIEKIKKWILLNKDVLEDYANGNLSTRELDTKLKPYED